MMASSPDISHEGGSAGWHTVRLAEVVKRQEGQFKATPQHCDTLAARLKILAVESFRFSYTLSRTPMEEVVRLKGSVQGRAVQECVATLEPVSEDIRETFDVLCGPEPTMVRLTREGHITEEDEPPEYTNGGVLDISEVAVQYFALGLNPYPRSSSG